jgi:3-oxoacyl-[acyl-carrier-protein] synthase II
VVTGMGAVTSQGTSVGEFWQGVRDGRVAIREVRRLSMDGYRTRIAGEVTDVITPERSYLTPDGFRDRAIDFTLAAAEEAMADCGVGVGAEGIDPERWGIVVGTCNAGLLAGEEWYSRRLSGEAFDPRLVLLVPPQAFAEALSGAFAIKGPALSIDTACAASANAIGCAAELIREGHADAVLTGGSDALSHVLLAGFHSLESLSPEPAAPYSRDRLGLSLGEGSGMMVLMSRDAALAHDARVRAEVLGYGLSADGYHPTAPHPEGRGAARAIRTALAQGGASPAAIRYVNSHGTGTAKNDTAETAATKAGLGEKAARAAAVSSTKSMIGHLLGGAGGVEGIITVKALEEQTAPPTANYRERDPECDLDYVPNEARQLTMDLALSNNFAFGGANASVLFARRDALAEAPPEPDVDRVVISGIGAVTAAGTDLDALWEAFRSGRDLTRAEKGRYLGRADFKASDFLSPKERKRVDRLGLFSIVASRLSLQDAGIELTDDNRERVGAIVGTGVGPMESMEGFAAPVMKEGVRGANPALFPNTVYNAAGGQVAMKAGATGPASTVTAGHAAGASALCYGFDLAARDHADAMICLGADTLTETVLDAYDGLGLLASSPPSSPAADGDGFALAEAGIAVLVERMGAAQARGARIYGEILGYAITSDARGVGRVDPEGSGIERAMRGALERAGVRAHDVAAIWANRCGLRVIDEAEEAAIAAVFADPPVVISPKLALGEPMGAGGALNAALALKGWEQGDAGLSPRGAVVVNSCSLGGTNFSIVLSPNST